METVSYLQTITTALTGLGAEAAALFVICFGVTVATIVYKKSTGAAKKA